jgi:predicted RNase H-like nuclease (RuvC/YqgF family)
MSKNYYWNDVSNLGSGKDAIKRGDPLPQKYNTDKRLGGWIESGVVTLDKPSKEAEIKESLENLEFKNMELRDKIDSLTKQLESTSKVVGQARTVSTQNAQLHERINKYSAAMMNNEEKISQVIKELGAKTLSKSVKEDIVKKLESIEIVKEA